MKVDPATGKATVLDSLHDDAWIREAVDRRRRRRRLRRRRHGHRVAAGQQALRCSCRRKTGYMHVYSLDVSAATPAAKALTSGKWEVTSAQLSADRKTLFLHDERGASGRAALLHDVGRRRRAHEAHDDDRARTTSTVSPDEKSLAVVYSYSHQAARALRDAVRRGRDADAGDDDADRGVAQLQVDRSEGHHLQGARRRRTSTRGSSRRR